VGLVIRCAGGLDCGLAGAFGAVPEIRGTEAGSGCLGVMLIWYNLSCVSAQGTVRKVGRTCIGLGRIVERRTVVDSWLVDNERLLTKILKRLARLLYQYAFQQTVYESIKWLSDSPIFVVMIEFGMLTFAQQTV